MDETAAKIDASQLTEAGESRRAASPLQLLATSFEPFYATVLRYLLHRVFQRELAEELTAETFYKAVGSVGRLQADEREVQMWLLRIATNLANSHYRREKMRRLLFGRFAAARADAAVGHDAGDGDLRAAKVRAALIALPAKYQTVVVLRYYEHMSFEQIAATLCCREATVRTRLSRGVRQLRERLNVQGMSAIESNAKQTER